MLPLSYARPSFPPCLPRSCPTLFPTILILHFLPSWLQEPSANIPGLSRYAELQELAKRKKEEEQRRQEEVLRSHQIQG